MTDKQTIGEGRRPGDRVLVGFYAGVYPFLAADQVKRQEGAETEWYVPQHLLERVEGEAERLIQQGLRAEGEAAADLGRALARAQKAEQTLAALESGGIDWQEVNAAAETNCPSRDHRPLGCARCVVEAALQAAKKAAEASTEGSK